MDALHQLEIILILFLQNLGAWLAEPMRLLSTLGYEEFYMLIMPSLFWCVDSALGFRVAIMLLLSNGLNCVFKLALHSPRPYWFDPRVKAYSLETSFGIPSGHAQNAASIWGLLATAVRQTWVKVCLVLVIFLIGFSRIYLGVHFISDVLLGWLLGGFLLWVFLKIERPVGAWLRARSLPQLLTLSLVTSVLLGTVVLLTAASLGNWQTPAEWVNNGLSASPESEVNPLNISDTFTLAGTWLGIMAGMAWMYHKKGGFDASGTPSQRLLRYVIGIIGIFFFWFALGQMFPRSADALSYAMRYFRYTLVGLWISAIAPLLFERLGLAGAPRKQVPSLSSPQNPL